MTWCKSCETHNLFAEYFWCKMTRIDNKRGWHCASNHCINLSNADSGQVFVKNIWTKAILFQLVIYSNLPNSKGKKLEREGGVIGYLSWWLKISLWQRDRTQTASDWARGGDSKIHQRLAGTTQSGLPVILCQFLGSLLWKQWFVKNLTFLWKL